MTWVKAHATALLALATCHGATHICLCGSVARGTDTESSDIDFYVCGFDHGVSGTVEHTEARQTANNLVKAIRDLCPYQVDVRGIPGWLLDPLFEASMRADSIDLSKLVE